MLPTTTTRPEANQEQIVTTRDLNADLVAYYPFNGNADDESGHNNHGIVRGATLTANRFGQPDRAYHFDGIDDYIEIADTNSLDLTLQASISLWFYYEPQATDDFYTLLEKSDPERDGHYTRGIIDNIRIYKRVLTHKDVDALYHGR